MTRSLLTCLAGILVVVASVCFAAPDADLVIAVPGLNPQPRFKTYSGYLTSTGSRHLHYWFVESQSSPAEDPLVLWFNGGPGCSSMEGMLREHGPFSLQKNGRNLTYNPYAWNKAANVLYMEAPAGVGFSYSDDGEYNTGDSEVANANYAALKNFFKKFPEYDGRSFFITGESYAGVYVPMLAAQVVHDDTINLAGIMIGNGLSSYDINDNSVMYFWYYHGLIGAKTWDRLVKECCGGSQKDCNFIEGAKHSLMCRLDVSSVQAKVYSEGINMYNILSPCAGGVSSGLRENLYRMADDESTIVHHDFGNLFRSNKLIHQHRLFLADARTNASMTVKLSPPCTNDTDIETYMNSAAVKKALHIAPNLPYWTLCSDKVSAGYDREFSTMIKFYETIMASGKKPRILLYNGDIDMACNFLGDEWFVDSLGKQLLVERRPWLVKDQDGYNQIAGYVKQFHRISFLTVKGAGHMVPTDKPKEAFEMLTRFIKNIPF